jgi:PD-(D/E)XK nuclease superfamily
MVTIQPTPLRPWSHSRSQMMNTCQRQFFFTYCAGARWDHPDPRMKELSLLKQVKPIAMWKGEIVHLAIGRYFSELMAGRKLTLTQLTQFAERLASKQWAFSHSKRYRREGRFRAGDAFAALFEHEYDIQDSETLEDALTHIRTCLANFDALDLQWSISKAFREGNQHLVEPPAWGDGATTFVVPEIKATVKVDLAFATPDRRYLIFDWKTGKTEEDATSQLEAYALWAHLSLGWPLESIVAHEVSLFRAQVSLTQLTPSAASYRSEQIRRSADLVTALVGDDSGVSPSLADFNYARHVSICRRCALQRVCQEFV